MKKIENLKIFTDELGTIFVKGLYTFNNISYSHKLVEHGNYDDEGSIDYCTLDQIKNWNIKITDSIKDE